MATIKMKKGNVYADIFDSPETIRTAQMQGYSLVKEETNPARQEVVNVDEPAQEETVIEQPVVEEKKEETNPAPKTAKRGRRRD